MTTSARLALALRGGYGLFLLTAPERLLAVGSPDDAPAWAPGIVRVLGARHLMQAGLLAVRPGLSGLGSFVDLAHAATDVACAAVNRPLRAPALLDTAVATALALSPR